MEGEVEKTLRNLTVVSMIKQHDKLITAGDTFSIHPPTMFRSLYRRWYGEARDQNMQRLHEMVHTACTHVGQMNDTCTTVECTDASSRVQVVQGQLRRVRLIQALRGAQRGLTNMIDTYTDDTSFQVRLRLLVQKIEDFVTSISDPSMEGFGSPHSAGRPMNHCLDQT